MGVDTATKISADSSNSPTCCSRHCNGFEGILYFLNLRWVWAIDFGYSVRYEHALRALEHALASSPASNIRIKARLPLEFYLPFKFLNPARQLFPLQL